MNKEVVIINETHDGMNKSVEPVVMDWNTLPEAVKKNVLEAIKDDWNKVILYEYNWDGEHDLSGHLDPLYDDELGRYKGQVPLGEPVVIKHIVEFCYSE